MTSILNPPSEQPGEHSSPSAPSSSSPHVPYEPTPRGPSPFTKGQGYVLLLLALAAVGLAAYGLFRPAPRYAYKVVSVQAQFTQEPPASAYNKENAAKLGPTSVDIKDEQLAVLGQEGWELVGTFLEVETTHPNYGNSEYVTGLQPNVRPQKAVLLFKKPL
jgi:hypothetical protein